MIDVVHRLLSEHLERVEKDSLEHGSLDMDAFIQYVHVRGRYAGLKEALGIVEKLMGERNVDRNI